MLDEHVKQLAEGPNVRNRFKFLKKTDRIKKVAFTNFPKTDFHDRNESHYLQSLVALKDLNLTSNFNQFILKTARFDSFEVILVNLDEVLQHVLEYLPVEECTIAMLELLNSLSRDFLEDFCARLPAVVMKIIEVAQKDIFHQEIFQELQLLFKNCQKFINVDSTIAFYKQLYPLLFNHKQHLREFTSIAFAQLLKRNFSSSLYSAILQSCLELDDADIKTVAHILFESFKVFNFLIHSKSISLSLLKSRKCFIHS